MELISVTILKPNGTRNGPFGVLATKKVHEKTREICQEEPRKPGTRSQVTEVRTSIQVFHL